MTDFSKLSKKQLEVFEQIAVGNDTGHNQNTIDSLFRRGLIASRTRPVLDHIGWTNEVYYVVPIPVHIDWCAWCARQHKDVLMEVQRSRQ